MTDERKIAERIADQHFENGWTKTQLADAIEKALVKVGPPLEKE